MLRDFKSFINESAHGFSILTGVIQKDGTVLSEDGTIHYLPTRGTDKDGYKEVLIDARSVGGDGEFYRQSIKPYIGMTVQFCRAGLKYNGYNFKIINTIKESIDEFTNKMISPKDYDEYLSKLTDNYGDEKRAKEELDFYLESIADLQVNGGELYRLVFLKQINHLKKNDLGFHWTLYKDDISRFYHNIRVEDEHYKPYLITAKFEPNSIDINSSLLNFSDIPDEQEVNVVKQPNSYTIEKYKENNF